MAGSDTPIVTIYTDGSCRPNPGPGGWAAVLLGPDNHPRTLNGTEPQTTNNRMELTAALKALQQLDTPHQVELFTDSMYLKDGVCRWLASWQQRGWQTALGDDVKNRDLWELLARELLRHTVSWNWVKGHGSDEWNILADQLAGLQYQPVKLPLADRNSVHIFLAISWRQKTAEGGWAGVMQYRDHYRLIGGYQRGGTGNSLHITSAINGLQQLKRSLPVHLYTTSGYLKDGAVSWLPRWRRRDWLTVQGEEVSNREEWQRLEALLKTIPVTFHQVDKALPPCHSVAAKIIAQQYCLERENQDSADSRPTSMPVGEPQ